MTVNQWLMLHKLIWLNRNTNKKNMGDDWYKSWKAKSLELITIRISLYRIIMRGKLQSNLWIKNDKNKNHKDCKQF